MSSDSGCSQSQGSVSLNQAASHITQSLLHLWFCGVSSRQQLPQLEAEADTEQSYSSTLLPAAGFWTSKNPAFTFHVCLTCICLSEDMFSGWRPSWAQKNSLQNWSHVKTYEQETVESLLVVAADGSIMCHSLVPGLCDHLSHQVPVLCSKQQPNTAGDLIPVPRTQRDGFTQSWI